MGAATSRLNKGLVSPSPPQHAAKQLLTWETLDHHKHPSSSFLAVQSLE